jgi:hypothetical protein
MPISYLTLELMGKGKANKMKGSCILIGFLVMAGSLFAQEIDSPKVPQAVRAKLVGIHPNASAIVWIHQCDVEASYSAQTGRTTVRQLCFRAIFRNKEKYIDMRFDSAALWYCEDESSDKPEMPIVAPQNAKDKITALYPGKADVSWEYSDETDISKYCEYEADYEDSAGDFHVFFDSAWIFLGSSYEIYEDSSLVPIHSINSYIKKNFKRSSFISAEIKKDTNQNTLLVTVLIEIKTRRYKRCTIEFDGKGNMIRQSKEMAYPGVF